MLKIKDKVRHKDNIEIISAIYLKINAETCDYNCAELEIMFESGRFYYDEITDYEYGIEDINKRLLNRADIMLEKVSDGNE